MDLKKQYFFHLQLFCLCFLKEISSIIAPSKFIEPDILLFSIFNSSTITNRLFSCKFFYCFWLINGWGNSVLLNLFFDFLIIFLINRFSRCFKKSTPKSKTDIERAIATNTFLLSIIISLFICTWNKI